MQKDHWGKDGMVWWYGVVEDRFDPLQVGRCKVRIFGWHIEDKQKMPTEELPWCFPMVPLDSGRMNTTGVMEGARVVGFFLDGVRAQEPVMMGLIPGFPEKPADPKIGYEDPRPDSLLAGHQVPREPEELIQHDDGSGNDIFEQPKKSRFPEEHFIPEPDTSRYARGYDGGFIEKTIVPLKIENIAIGQTDVPTGTHPAGTGTDVTSPGTEWTERETAFDPKFPYNKVYFSEGGHIVEIDDTPGKERLHWYHRVGSFREIDPVGGLVEKIVDNQFHIVLEHRHIHIEASDVETVDWFKKVYVNKDAQAGFNYDQTVGAGGDYNITTEGGKLNIRLEGDWNVYVNGSAYIEVEQDLIGTVHRDVHLTVDRDAYTTVKGDLNAHVLGDATVQVDGDLRCTVGGDWIGKVFGDKTQIIGGDYQLFVGGDIDIYSGGDFTQLALGNIDQTALQQMRRMAGLLISDTALTIYHNAAVTNCTAILTGFTIDSDGDTTDPGPPGPPPSILPSGIGNFATTVIDAIVTDLLQSVAPNLILQALTNILTDVELATEYATSQVEANPSSPVSGSAASASTASSGPMGPSIPVDGPGGFLWKPIGANSGVVTVLFGSAGGASIYFAVQDGDQFTRGDKIEDLSFIKTYNKDGRSIYRGSKPGAQYGSQPIIVSVGGKDFVVSDPSKRHD